MSRLGFTTIGRDPGRLLGGGQPTAASIVDDAALHEAGLHARSIWLPVPGPAFAVAMAWVAQKVLPQLD
ncbi:hypothetical protein [Nocardia nepalensis]|uniref:hypothetical protein n=1 Tax=Nocardia nepalensis TaxID=3375448 RepID=UPI003B67A319